MCVPKRELGNEINPINSLNREWTSRPGWCVMGLDAVEMLMDVEERFGITLRTAEFASLVRVEDSRGLCWRELPLGIRSPAPAFRPSRRFAATFVR